MMTFTESKWFSGRNLEWVVENSDGLYSIRLVDTHDNAALVHICGIEHDTIESLRVQLGQVLQDSATIEVDECDLNFNPKESK